MPLDIQPSIATMGLRPYLDQTRHKHNGYGYDDFMGWLKKGVSAKEIARSMSVSPMTVGKCKAIARLERRSSNS